MMKPHGKKFNIHWPFAFVLDAYDYYEIVGGGHMARGPLLISGSIEDVFWVNTQVIYRGWDAASEEYNLAILFESFLDIHVTIHKSEWDYPLGSTVMYRR